MGVSMSQRGWRVAAGVVGGCVVLGLLGYVGWIAMFVASPSPCGFELRDQQVSPDGQRKAGVVEVNCGATTDYATWLVMTDAGRPFDYERDRLAAIDGLAMRMRWEGSRLIVSYRASRPISLKQPQPPAVEYRPL
jgi:hypothetical protein